MKLEGRSYVEVLCALLPVLLWMFAWISLKRQKEYPLISTEASLIKSIDIYVRICIAREGDSGPLLLCEDILILKREKR